MAQDLCSSHSQPQAILDPLSLQLRSKLVPVMPFAPKLVDALDSEEVQAKIFNAIVKPVFDEAMAAFGKASGGKVGEMLGEFKLDYERKLELIKEEFEKDIQKVTNDRHGRITEN